MHGRPTMGSNVCKSGQRILACLGFITDNKSIDSKNQDAQLKRDIMQYTYNICVMSM